MCLGLGLVAFPLAKLLFIPNYVFNFLTTLVHEIGHSLCGWAMGMPSVPAVSLAGGGVASYQDQTLPVVVAVWIGTGTAIWVFRRRKPVWIPLAALLAIQPLLAFTDGKFVLFYAGGMLLEIVGAGVCLAVCLAGDLDRAFERPLYALWGWWMLLNRMGEAFLMLRDPSYRDAQEVIESGLAAGLPSDLTQMTDLLEIGPEPFLVATLVLGALALPAAILYARLKAR